MKRSKRMLYMLLALVLAIGLFTVPAAAATAQQDIKAKALYQLGLFNGYDTSGTNFGLDDKLNRQQALVLFIRILGEESAAKAWTGAKPYSDVPDNNYALPYIGYAKEKGYTVGIGNNVFGFDLTANMKQMTTFALRGLGYNDQSGKPTDFTFDTSVTFAKSLDMLDSDKIYDPFLRGNAVDVLFGAIGTNFKGKDYDLLSKLMNDGIVTRDQYDKAMAIVEGKVSNNLASGTYTMKCQGKYFRVSSSKLYIYDTTPVQSFTVSNNGDYSYIKTSDGKYLALSSATDPKEGEQLVTSTTAYKWVISKLSNGAYNIMPYSKTSMVVNAYEAKTANGTKLIVWSANSTATNGHITMTAVKKPVTGVKLDQTAVSLAVGKTLQLTGTISPADATNQNVTWSSSNSAVATVSDTGLVKGIKAGTATITVKTVDGAKTATCKITVTSGATTATFKLNNSSGKTITELYMVDSGAGSYGKDFLSSNGYPSLGINKYVNASITFDSGTKFDIYLRYSDGSEAEALGLSFATATSAGGTVTLGTGTVKLTNSSGTALSTVALTPKGTDLTDAIRELGVRYNASVKAYNALLVRLTAAGLDKDAEVVKEINTLTASINAMGKVINEGSGQLTAAQIKEYNTALTEVDNFVTEMTALLNETGDLTAETAALKRRVTDTVSRFNKQVGNQPDMSRVSKATQDTLEAKIKEISGPLSDLAAKFNNTTAKFTFAQITEYNKTLDDLLVKMNALDTLIETAKTEASQSTARTINVKFVNGVDKALTNFIVYAPGNTTSPEVLSSNGNVTYQFTVPAATTPFNVTFTSNNVNFTMAFTFDKSVQNNETLTITFIPNADGTSIEYLQS